MTSVTLTGFGFEPHRDFSTFRCQVPLKFAFSAAPAARPRHKSAGRILTKAFIGKLPAFSVPEDEPPGCRMYSFEPKSRGGPHPLRRPWGYGDVAGQLQVACILHASGVVCRSKENGSVVRAQANLQERHPRCAGESRALPPAARALAGGEHLPRRPGD